MRLASTVVTSAEPAQFSEAVAAMNAARVRPEIELGPIRPPQRLAPYSYALGAEVKREEAVPLPENSAEFVRRYQQAGQIGDDVTRISGEG